MKGPNREMHYACRSLLQKAVRRGDERFVEQTVHHLHQVGDGAWIRARAAVITFEECWPLGAEIGPLADLSSVLGALLRVARSTKMKDAAGLGTLAHALSQGDTSVLSRSSADRDIKVVSEGIKRPEAFWNWVGAECKGPRERSLVEVAQTAYRRGGWPWDRAFMIAAAYLTVTKGLPESIPLAEPRHVAFPLWVALDKHTPQGKTVLRAAARRAKLPWRQLLWSSFYCEGARANQSEYSQWWQEEVQWRLSRVDLNYESACALWAKVRPLISDLLESEVQFLLSHLTETPDHQRTLL